MRCAYSVCAQAAVGSTVFAVSNSCGSHDWCTRWVTCALRDGGEGRTAVRSLRRGGHLLGKDADEYKAEFFAFVTFDSTSERKTAFVRISHIHTRVYPTCLP